MSKNNLIVSLYVVKNNTGLFFSGYDNLSKSAGWVADPKEAKKFSNKYDIKLRPNETVVELSLDLLTVDISISEPFRPVKRK